MHETVATYFAGEKNAGLILAAIGIVMAAGATVFFKTGPQLRPLAYTFAAWAAFHLSIGIGLYLRTGPQVAGLAKLLHDDAAAFYAAELPRMHVVQRNFVIIEFVWLTLILGSAGLAIWQKRSPLASGIALGMLINASVLLAFDIIAERRGAVYFAKLGEGPDSSANPSGRADSVGEARP